jgi:hypothetical protein
MPGSQGHKANPQQWVEKYGDYLFNYAIVRVNDSDAAKNLVQETFLSALKALDRFRGESTEQTWLTSILPLVRVVCIHMAGHEQVEPDLIIDAHGQPINETGLDLFDWTIQKTDPVPVLGFIRN